MITREFKLYLNAGVGVAPVINANQFDQDEEWVFTLLQSDGTVYTPSTGAIIGLKQDGTTILNAGTVNESGQVVITETEQMTAVPGANLFEILIDGNTHGTANFVVFVERRPGDIDNPSESDISLFQEAITAAGNVTQFQADISALQSGLATTNANLTSEANTRASADATLQSNISAEASTRQTQDAVLQAEIDQIIAPSGEAPSAAEVENARIGVDGTTYDTLGNAIRTQVSDLKNAINTSDKTYFGSDIAVNYNGNTILVGNVPVVAENWYKITVVGNGILTGNGPVIVYESETNNIIRTYNSPIDGTIEFFYLASTSQNIDVKSYLQTSGGTIRALVKNVTDELKIEGITENKNKLMGKLSTTPSPNMFDRYAILSGYYLNDGVPTALTGWNISEFIAVSEGVTYSITQASNTYYYNSQKAKVGSTISASPFTVPTGMDIRYIRVSVQDSIIDTFMLNEGDTLADYAPYGGNLDISAFNSTLIENLKTEMGISGEKSSPFEMFRNHVTNPFIKTAIKTVGDSITAGVGGTGYSPTDETIIGSQQKTNVKTAICWANMLYHYLINNFGGDKYVDFSFPQITVNTSVLNFNRNEGTQTITNMSAYSANDIERKIIAFEMYGSEITVNYSKSAVYGIFDIYVDGEKQMSVDCYDSTTNHNASVTINGLTEGNHLVEIYSTNTKNTLSTGKGFYIHGFTITKTIEFHNYGISGTQTSAGYNTNGRYTENDDFVFIQYGTNDRVGVSSWSDTRSELKKLYNLLSDTYGITPILMASVPASEAQDTTSASTIYKFHMSDVQIAVSHVANDYGVPFIDNYNSMLEYSELKGIDYTTLLADGLHPNDRGYYFMYRNIIKSLGLPLMPEYREWWHPTV